MKESLSRTRKLTIIAQDPGVKDLDGNILKTQIMIPAEELAKGPRGYRVAVIDYDTSTGKFYRSGSYDKPKDGHYEDPFQQALDKKNDKALLNDPSFHCQNVYAIVMRILARFEFALGRRVSWGFNGHQIHVAPHAFADANAFYSERDRALCFGYFNAGEYSGPSNQIVFTCLSHDVVAHETTHALLDGLRQRYTDPSSPDQAGFHEGFADIVALLSVFSLKDVVSTLLPQVEDIGAARLKAKNKKAKISHKRNRKKERDRSTITRKYLVAENLRDSVLLGLADEMGEALSGIRGSALRRSVSLEPRDDAYIDESQFGEPHKRGELLVASVMNSFLEVWMTRLNNYLKKRGPEEKIDISLIVDEGASAAENLLTMCIRALDYAPPTDIRFGDYLSALVTADSEVVPDDSKYHYRETLLKNFKAFGIKPATRNDDGTWDTCDGDKFSSERTHFESLLRDPTEVFRFIWDNRGQLFQYDTNPDERPSLFEDAYTEVQSVRPSLRIAPDGFAIRETVASYIQMVTLRADELYDFGIDVPDSMPKETEVRLYGGGNLIFDEYGKLKYHIRNRIFNADKQTERLQYLWSTGYFNNAAYRENLFSRMHLQKTLGVPMKGEEQF